MSIRDLAYQIAGIIAFALVIGLLALFSYSRTNGGIFQYRHHTNDKEYQDIDHHCDAIERAFVNKQIAGDDAESRATGKPTKQEYDSCQQWRSADASLKSAHYAKWQGIAAVAAAALSLFTMIIAVAAAFFAKQAADHTLSSVKNAKRSSRRELRAYFSVNGADAIIKDGELVASVQYVNCGQTPGYAVAITTKLTVDAKDAWDDLPDIDVPTIRSRGTLGPNIPVTATRKEKVSDSVIAALESGDAVAYVKARIDYVDIFKRPRYLTFLAYNAEPIKKGVRSHLNPAPVGNDGD